MKRLSPTFKNLPLTIYLAICLFILIGFPLLTNLWLDQLIGYLICVAGIIPVCIFIKFYLGLSWKKATLISFVIPVGIIITTICLYVIFIIFYEKIEFIRNIFVFLLPILLLPAVLGVVRLKKWIVHRWLKSFVTVSVSLVILILSVGLGLPLWGRHDPYPPRLTCANNLKQIGLALHLYANENNDTFPPSLLDLYPEYLNSTQVFYCPGEHYRKIRKRIIYPKTFDPSKIGYTYIPGLTEKSSPDSILAQDKSPNNHKGKYINILYVDGQVNTKKLK